MLGQRYWLPGANAVVEALFAGLEVTILTIGLI